MLGFIVFIILLAVIGYVVFSPRFTGYRTQIAAYITATIGGVLPMLHDFLAPALPYASDILAYLKDLDWRTYLSPDKAPYIIIGTTILFFILRRMTTTPVGTK